MRKGGVQLNRERGGRKWDEDGLQTNAVSDDSKCEGGKKNAPGIFRFPLFQGCSHAVM